MKKIVQEIRQKLKMIKDLKDRAKSGKGPGMDRIDIDKQY